jgi:hypothetical protein
MRSIDQAVATGKTGLFIDDSPLIRALSKEHVEAGHFHEGAARE